MVDNPRSYHPNQRVKVNYQECWEKLKSRVHLKDAKRGLQPLMSHSCQRHNLNLIMKKHLKNPSGEAFYKIITNNSNAKVKRIKYGGTLPD